jgi:DNA repair protein RadC
MAAPIKEWNRDDQPREKFLDKGRNAVSDAELIAILIASGNKDESAVELSRRILKDYNNDLYQLGMASLAALQKYKGIGEVKAITIAAALELGRRRKEQEKRQQIVEVKSSQDAFDIFLPYLQDLQHEEMWAIFLNRANRVMTCENLSKGGVAGTVVDPKILFKRALELQASGIILAHNHPSGNLQPSGEDISVTSKIKNGGSFLDISILDHLIIAGYRYYSFADEGKI